MKKLKIILQSNIFYVIAILLTIIYVFINYNFFNYSKINYNVTEFTGKILKYDINGNKLSLLLKNKEKIIANYTISSEEEQINLKKSLVLGSTIKITGSFEEPAVNSIPNTFNYKKYLNTKKIYLIMNTTKYELNSKCNIFYKIKNKIYFSISNRKYKEYYSLFILGDKTYLADEEYNLYKNNGIVHLFAISGMHISLIVLVLSKFRINKKIIYIILILYSFLVSVTPSVCRVVVFLILKSIFKNICDIKLLIITAMIFIFLNPFIIFDVGFQYSYIITFGLMYIKPKNFISLAVFAFALSMPITLYNNFEINIFSIIVNIIVVPLVSFLIFPVTLLSYFIKFLEPVLGIFINLLILLNKLLSNLSINIITGKPLLFTIFIYYILLMLNHYTKRIILIIMLFFFVTILKYKLDLNYYVYYLNVGQGDCSVIITPKQKDVIMIDTGGYMSYKTESWKLKRKNYDQAYNIILFLKSLAIDNISLLALSHGDYDHIGNAQSIINKFKVNKIMINFNQKNDLEEDLIKNNVVINYYHSRLIDIKNLNDYISNDENESSLVFNINIRGKYFTYTGDIPSSVMNKLISRIKISNYIKIPHHGSKNSYNEDFYKTIKPEIGIISSGKNNRYNHPSTEIINLLNKLNIPYLNTQIDNSICYKINKKVKRC